MKAHPSVIRKAYTLLLPDIKEQVAIATILIDMDTEIEKLESQLTKYQNIKQGMMQTLLTGKIRLLTK
jgi:type I restriction enzyme S subunit